MGFVLLSLTMQMMLVVAIHHKKPKKMWIELLGTVTFTKLAFNKWRVLTNAKMDGHEIMQPVNEMMMFKLVRRRARRSERACENENKERRGKYYCYTSSFRSSYARS